MTDKALITFTIIIILIAVGFVVARNTTFAPNMDDVEKNEITVLFAGDMMFDRWVRQSAETKHGYDNILSEELKTLIARADYSVANLEGPISTYPSKSVGTGVDSPNNTIFTFATSTARALGVFGFDAVSLANNHIHNFGTDGIVQTRSYLSDAGIAYFGDPEVASSTSYIANVGGIDVAFVGYTDWGNPGRDFVISELERLEGESDVQVVVAHWGREYTPEPTEVQRDFAERFVDAGADLIVGAHSHVIGEMEVIDGVPVYYSLGNFIFDQYWIEDVRCGALIEVTFVRDGEEITIASTTPYFTELEPGGTTALSDCRTEIDVIAQTPSSS